MNLRCLGLHSSVVCIMLLAPACPMQQASVVCAEAPPQETGVRHTCSRVAGADHQYQLVLPEADGPRPLIFLLHGGSGSANIVHRVSCPEGDEESQDCFAFKAAAMGYVVVIPEGSDGPAINHVWAAGGGVDGYRCTAEPTCEEGLNHVPLFEAYIAEIGSFVALDGRTFSTGISNGAAMSYRLACDLSDTMTAIAPVAGPNSALPAPGCSPTSSVGVLHIHGTADPCARYEGGTPACPAGQPELAHISVEQTLFGDVDEGFVGWVTHNGCESSPLVEAIPDTEDDGTSSEHQRFEGCAAGGNTEHIKIDGGGHTWPGGSQELPEDVLGALARDFSANDAILEFFERF